VLFSLLAAIYGEFIERNFFASEVFSAGELAQVSHAFFITFLLIQWVAVLALTPIYVGSAIADEKDRRTLEYIFTTELRNREIVLGKLMSRLAVLILILLAGLPLLSILQLLGGVSPELLWSGFAVTGLTMLSLSGIGIYWSVQCRTSREAILLTFLTVILYFAIYGIALFLWWEVTRRPVRFPGLDDWDWETIGGLGLWCLASGNPFHAFYDVATAAGIAGGRGYSGVLMEWLIRYAVFHGLLFVLFVSLAILQVRSAYIRQAYGAAKKTRSLTASPTRPFRLVIGNWPMIWKELLTDRGNLHGAAAKVMSGLLALSILVLTGAILVLRLKLDSTSTTLITALFLILLSNSLLVIAFMQGSARLGFIAGFTVIGGAIICAFSLANTNFVWWSSSHRFEFIDVLPRLFLPLYVALIWFASSIRAAYSINAEREKQTLDVLLSTLLTEREILAGKWIGAMCYARWLTGILFTIWFLEVCAGLLHPLGLLTSLAAFVIYLALFTGIGLFCGTLVRSSLGAGMLAALVCLVLMGAHFFVTVPVMMTLTHSLGPISSDYIITAFLTATPTVVMGFAHINGWELETPSTFVAHDFRIWVITRCILWTLVWALVSYLLYNGAVRRFRSRCGRITLTEPRSPRHSVLTISTGHAMVGKPIQSRSS
jgi:ABC-type transport system involved in multi-copper enzyme maturation permease subunit